MRDVVLLDKDQFPRDKTCGSALSPNGVALLDQLGVGAEVRRLGYSIDALPRSITPGGREMHLASAESAIILLRKHFDNLLVERARALGVDFRPGFHARELVREGGRAVGVRSREGEVVRGSCVIAADGAHSVFSIDPRPRRTISTLMGWWEGFPFEPHTVEMVFDKNLAPLYGWMFPEDGERVNIGICMDGEDAGGGKTARNVRDVFQRFLDDHYRDRLRGARQIGRLKGHPISYTTWIAHTHAPRRPLPRRGGAHHPQRDRRGHLPGDAERPLRGRGGRRPSSRASASGTRRRAATPAPAAAASPRASPSATPSARWCGRRSSTASPRSTTARRCAAPWAPWWPRRWPDRS